MPNYMTALAAVLCLLLFSTASGAQQSQMFDQYEVHYSVVNSTFLDPKIAATYGITRGKKSAILNLAVREHLGDEPNGPTEARTVLLKGKTWDLIQNQPLEFQQVKESTAIYYIAEFKFINEEWRFFEVDFRPEGADKTYTFKLKHQLYIN
ncbi:MAG: hypothetical protein ACJAZ0_002119 [Halioglobus sp.]|jgi:hypothetical protein